MLRGDAEFMVMDSRRWFPCLLKVLEEWGQVTECLSFPKELMWPLLSLELVWLKMGEIFSWTWAVFKLNYLFLQLKCMTPSLWKALCCERYKNQKQHSQTGINPIKQELCWGTAAALLWLMEIPRTLAKLSPARMSAGVWQKRGAWLMRVGAKLERMCLPCLNWAAVLPFS